MTNRAQTAILLLMLPQGLAGCDGSHSSIPSGPTPVTSTPGTPAPGALRVFTDAAWKFSTSDLRDAHDQIVQFNTANELIWTADGTHLPGYPVQGNAISADVSCKCWLVVRFGTSNGERRAYLTADYGHDNPGTVVDLAITGGALVVSRTMCLRLELTRSLAWSPKKRRQDRRHSRTPVSGASTRNKRDGRSGRPTKTGSTRFTGCITAAGKSGCLRTATGP